MREEPNRFSDELSANLKKLRRRSLQQLSGADVAAATPTREIRPTSQSTATSGEEDVVFGVESYGERKKILHREMRAGS
jgi:hypothetical protein